MNQNNNNKSNINNNKNSATTTKATQETTTTSQAKASQRVPLIQRKISEVITILDEVIPKLEKNSEERLKLLVASEKLCMLLEYLKYTWRLRKFSTSKTSRTSKRWSRA